MLTYGTPDSIIKNMLLWFINILLRSNDFQKNRATQVIIKFMRYHVLIIADLELQRGIDTTYVVPIRGVILDEKIPKLSYYGPISVYKQEGL